MEWPAELHTRERPSESPAATRGAEIPCTPEDRLTTSSPPTSSTAKASRHHLVPCFLELLPPPTLTTIGSIDHAAHSRSRNAGLAALAERGSCKSPPGAVTNSVSMPIVTDIASTEGAHARYERARDQNTAIMDSELD